MAFRLQRYGAEDAVAAAGESLDEARFPFLGIQCAADDGDVLGEVGLVHNPVRPDGLEDFLLGDDLRGLFQKDEKGFGGFADQMDGLAILQKDFSVRVQAKPAETVDPPVLQGVTSGFRIFLGTF